MGIKYRGIKYSDMTDEQAAQWARQLARAVHRDPDRYLTQEVTPFASAADLMGGPPPPRWRLWARARWRGRLFRRAYQELLQQRTFAQLVEELSRARRLETPDRDLPENSPLYEDVDRA